MAEHPRVLKSYPHPVGLNEVIIDLDTKEGIRPENVLDEARRFIQYLTRYLEVEDGLVRVFFSGSKGYHVHLPNLFGFKPSDNLPAEVKATLEGEFDFLESMDTTMIRKNGLIRVPYSKHQETGLYKQPLPWDLFWKGSVEDIMAYSRVPTFMPWDLPDEWDPVLQRIRRSPEPVKRGVYTVSNEHTTTRVTCMQKLYQRGAVQGRGHNDSLRLASWLRRMGLPREAALHTLRGWYGFKDDDDQVKVVNSIYDRQYVYSCDDEVMREFCDEKCIFYKHGWADETNETMVQDSDALLAGLQEYADKIAAGGGIDVTAIWPNMPVEYDVLPGECVIVTGDTGMGKSSLIQNLLIKQFPIMRKKVLYLNLEMNEALATRRFLQVAHSLTKREVLAELSKGRGKVLMEPLSHIQMISVPPKHTDVIMETRRHKPDIVCIDTTDAIEVPEAGNNEMHQMKVIIEMMRKLAQQEQIIVIGIHHIKKAASERGIIDLNSLTGNRATVTKADHVWALLGSKGSDQRILKSLKTRDGDDFKIPLKFVANRMQMVDRVELTGDLFK